jgi:hypothetical protein
MDVVTGSAKQNEHLSTVEIECSVCGHAVSSSNQVDGALISA